MKKILLLIAFLFFGLGFGQNPADIDNSYDFKDKMDVFGSNVYVKKICVLPNNKIIALLKRYNTSLANPFASSYKYGSNVKQELGEIIRLNQDYSIDDTFHQGTTGLDLINDIDLSPSGDIFVAGTFSFYNGVPKNGIVKLTSEGLIDETFNLTNTTNLFSTFITNKIQSIKVLSNGKVLIAGAGLRFATTNFSIKDVARLSSTGSVDLTFGFSNYIIGLITPDRLMIKLQSNGKIILSAISSVAIDIFRLNNNGGFDSTFFNAGTSANFVNANFGSTIFNLEVLTDDSIMVLTDSLYRIIKLDPTGHRDYTFASNFSSTYFSVNPDNTMNVVDCSLTSDYCSNRIKRIDTNGVVIWSKIIGNSAVFSLPNNEIISFPGFIQIIAGIDYYQTNGSTYTSGKKPLKISSTGSLLSNETDKSSYFLARKIIPLANGESLLLGKVGGALKYHSGIKKIDISGDLSINENLSNTITVENLALADAGISPNFNFFYDGLVQPDGKIILLFSKFVNSSTNNYLIIRLNQDYTLDTSFSYNNGTLNIDKVVLLSNSKLLVASSTSSQSKVFCLNNDGSIDTNFHESNYKINANYGWVRELKVIAGNKIIVGGNFNNYTAFDDNSSSITTYNHSSFTVLNENGSQNINYHNSPNEEMESISSIEMQADGKIIIAGGRYPANPNSIFGGLIRLNTDFTFDNSFFADQYYGVRKFKITNDGKILVLESQAYDYPLWTTGSRFLRLNQSGQTDASFNQAAGFNYRVYDFKVENNGNFIAVGSFTKYNGTWCNGSVRLIGGESFQVVGNNKIDSDLNGCDINDFSLPFMKFSLENNNQFVSNSSGNYSINYGLPGNYQITPVFENPAFFSISPSNLTVSFPSMPSPVSQNFCITPNGVHPDLEVTLLPLNVARPGFQAKYKLVYKNKGNQLQSGTVNFNFNDAVLNFVSATTTVSSQTLNNLNWSFANLNPFETKEIVITLLVNTPTATPPVNSGFVLNYTTTIASTQTDEMPSDNTFVYNQTVVNSFDPNDKTCLEGATIATTKVGDYVHYMIRFENTGTYNAQNITVKDIIDTAKFDINSIVPTSGSGLFITRVLEGNRIEFYFENINLPFAVGTNTGYVAFKIKTKATLVAGDSFSNTAGIYFDYNSAITTNTTVTTVSNALKIEDFAFENYFTLFPNPVNDVLNIDKKNNIDISSISIYNTLGQLVLVIPNAKETQSVDVSTLQTGNYFVKINSDKGTATTKFVKM